MLRRRLSVLALAALAAPLLAGSARADSTADLIELDRQWGIAGTKGDVDAVAKLLADNLVSVDDERVGGKKDELASVKAEPAGGPYEAIDYKVTLVGTDMAIMTHRTTGKDAHHSLHLWSRKNGQWQVIATSTTPAKSQ